MQDDVYRTPQTQLVDFAFNEAVADVFPDMIRRSVIGYETVIPITGLLAARHLGEQGTAFDLGCSLGATAQALLTQNQAANVRVVGVDNSQAMIDKAVKLNQDPRLEFRHADLRDVDLQGADVVVLNYVMQFLPIDARTDTLRKIRSQMSADGLLIVSEKVRAEDPARHQFFDAAHLAWKRANGYSDLEVSQKRTALENVMHVDSIPEHEDRFARTGFGQVTRWYQCMNWVSFLAYPKSG